MRNSSERQITGMRQCGYCGKYAAATRTECPHCHELFPELPATSRRRTQSGGEIRRGVLYMILAGVIHYFAGGYSHLDLPIPVSTIVPLYLTPLLFFGGLGFVVYGLLRRLA